MNEKSQQYMHDRGTDRLRAAIQASPNPTRAEIERAREKCREIVKRQAARVRATVNN